MRWFGLLLIVPLVAQAAPGEILQVSVVSGSDTPQEYNLPLTEHNNQIDLRERHRYHVAAKDLVRKRDVCREDEYKTGLLLSIRPLGKSEDNSQPVEVVGQVSSIVSVADGQKLACGVNQVVKMKHQAFSDTVQVQPGRTKMVVIDGKYTVMLKLL